MIKGILFDKDGTLIEFEHLWHEIITTIFETLEKEYLISQPTIQLLKEKSGYLENGFEKESLIQYGTTSEIIAVWITILEENEKESKVLSTSELLQILEKSSQTEKVSIHLLDSVLETLRYLKSKGYALGIATADTRESTEYMLRRTQIIDYFDFLGCNEEGILAKPDAKLALDFCEKFKLAPSELLIVGDSVNDMIFAQNANAHFAGIKTAYNDENGFVNGHVCVVEKIKDIIKIFDL